MWGGIEGFLASRRSCSTAFPSGPVSAPCKVRGGGGRCWTLGGLVTGVVQSGGSFEFAKAPFRCCNMKPLWAYLVIASHFAMADNLIKTNEGLRQSQCVVWSVGSNRLGQLRFKTAGCSPTPMLKRLHGPPYHPSRTTPMYPRISPPTSPLKTPRAIVIFFTCMPSIHLRARLSVCPFGPSSLLINALYPVLRFEGSNRICLSDV